MPIDLTELVRPAPRNDPLPAPALAGTRSQAMQRLQIGLFGLAAMVLLVGLANIILTNARENEAKVVPEAASTVAAEAETTPGSDPLANAGVVPDLPAEPEAPTGTRAGTGTEAGNAPAPALQP